MQLNRRALLGGVAASALSAAAHGQIMVSGGKVLTSGGNVLTAPPIPAPSGGGLLATQITLTNPAGQPTQTNPFVTFGVPIARSEFPGSGFKLALYDAGGSSKITDLQVDQTTAGWRPDLSINYAVVTGYATGTTLSAGSTATFTVKAEQGSAPTTPVCSLATLAANSDIKAICQIGADTATLSVNTLIANFSGAPSLNPQGYIRQWKSGPYACEWCFGGYLPRNSDGAYHRWAFLKLYVTALSASGPFIVRGYSENPNSYGANPNGTWGDTGTASPLVVVDSIDIYNGTTFIGACGGVNDLNNATFAPSDVNIAQGGIKATFNNGVAANLVLQTARNPIGFVSTGTLPAGLGSASTTTYWAAYEGRTGNVIPFLSRINASRLVQGGISWMAAPASGATVAANKYIYANGALYYSTTGGVSTGALPTGATFADNSAGGTLVWTALTPQITSTGSGTHTMVMKSEAFGGQKASIAGPDTYPFWNGAGSLPKLLVGYDRNYVVAQTKCCPPLDPAITPAAWIGTLPRFLQNMTYLPGEPNVFYIGDVSESNMDERINMFSPTAFASIALPQDVGMALSCRLMALSWTDRNVFWRDERGQEVAVTNFGPNRLGSSYPGMPPTNSTMHVSVAGTGSPKMIAYQGWSGYGGGYGDSEPPDPAHMSNPLYWPALTSGDPMFHDALIEHANFMFSSVGSGNHIATAIFNGLNLSWVLAFQQQTRAAGHQLQSFAQAEWICPDAHPAKQYFSDIMDDTSQIGQLWANAHVGPNGQSIGFLPFAYPGGVTWQGEETWMMSYIHIAMLGEVLKDNRPGFRQIMATYLWKSLVPLFDSDVGGSEQLIDIQWDNYGSYTGANPPFPPTEAQFLTSVPDRLAGNPVTWAALQVVPPPTKLFINGILSDQSKTVGGYTYRSPGAGGSAFPASSYGPPARAAMQMGKMAGIPQYAKVADRIEAFTAQYYNGVFCNWTAQATTGNPNGLMYAMKAQ